MGIAPLRIKGRVRKPGRNSITLLIIINMAFWLLNVR